MTFKSSKFINDYVGKLNLIDPLAKLILIIDIFLIFVFIDGHMALFSGKFLNLRFNLTAFK